MAITTIGDIITGNVPVLESYLTVDPTEKTAFFESGVLTPVPYAADIANGPSNKASLPFWKPIDASIEPNYSNDIYADVAEPRAIETGEMDVRVAYLNEGFGQADLTVELTSQNPLQSVAARLDNFWQRQMQRRLLATCAGIKAENVANGGSDMIVSTTGGFNATGFIDATQTLGDALGTGTLSVIAVHSYVYGQMRKEGLIDFIRDNDNNLLFATYQGARIVVDDSMTVSGTGADRVFTSIIFGSGAVGYGNGSPRVPVATERQESRGNGGGVEVLWSRKTVLLHPLGYSFTSNTITGNGDADTGKRSASWSDLALAANWTRVLDRKQIPIAFLETKVA
ncbi:hypothetical protein [Rosenbergiella metrosideri]|uniref:hypothetical protein n=1 Tax=Rosenbergiella metrosideri TaxID=2921185 RepID=UPI001F4F6D9F|nr:hypothetical protein [Rosenbergiella metrosideri]